jgi:hypothetical protein
MLVATGVASAAARAPEGERAPLSALPRPSAFQAATSGCDARTMDGMRLSALRLPYLRRFFLVFSSSAKLGCRASRER